MLFGGLWVKKVANPWSVRSMLAAGSCDTVTVWPGSRRPMWTAGSDSCVLTLWWSGENAVMAFQAVCIYSELVTMESPQDVLISGHAVFERTYSYFEGRKTHWDGHKWWRFKLARCQWFFPQKSLLTSSFCMFMGFGIRGQMQMWCLFERELSRSSLKCPFVSSSEAIQLCL